MQRTEKRCPRCQETKPRSEWGKNAASPDGLHSMCKACDCERHRVYTAQGLDGLNQFAERSGLSKEDSSILWHTIRGAETCCTICGVPGHRLAAYERKNAPCPSFHLNHRKMEIDRIIPGSMGGEYRKGNVRPLCPRCNYLRGAARFSDYEVRAKMWVVWQKWEDMKHLRWFIGLHVVNGVYTLKGPDDEGTPGI